MSGSPAQETLMSWASPGRSPSPHENVSCSPGVSSDDVFAQRADAELGAGEVLQDRDRPADLRGRVAHAVDGLGVLIKRSVRVVQPCDVHPRLDHAHQRLRLARGWADGGDDLRAAHHRKVSVAAPVCIGLVGGVASNRARSLTTTAPRATRGRGSRTSAAASKTAWCWQCTSKAGAWRCATRLGTCSSSC